MFRRFIALSAGFLSAGAGCWVILHLFTHWVPFGVCGNGWPPPPFKGGLMVAMWFLYARFGLALLVGAALAIAVKRSASTATIVLAAILAAVAFEIAMTALEAHGIMATGQWPPGLWMALFRYAALRTVAPAVAGLVISAWAVSMRKHQTTMPAPATCARILGAVALALVGLGAFGLASRHRTYFRSFEQKPSDLYPVADSLVVIALGLVVAGVALAIERDRRTHMGTSAGGHRDLQAHERTDIGLGP